MDFLEAGCHDINQKVIFRVGFEGNVAVCLFHDFVDLSALLSSDELLQFIGHLTTDAHTIRVLIVERDVASFEEQIEENANGGVVAIDFEAIAGEIDLRASLPCQVRQFTRRLKRRAGIGKNDVGKLKIIRNLTG